MQYVKNENVKEMYLCLCSLFKIHSLKSFIQYDSIYSLKTVA